MPTEAIPIEWYSTLPRMNPIARERKCAVSASAASSSSVFARCSERYTARDAGLVMRNLAQQHQQRAKQRLVERQHCSRDDENPCQMALRRRRKSPHQ